MLFDFGILFLYLLSVILFFAGGVLLIYFLYGQRIRHFDKTVQRASLLFGLICIIIGALLRVYLGQP